MANKKIDMKENIIIHELLKRFPNRFLLSIAIAKRSKQLKGGSKPLVDVKDDKFDPIEIALREIYQDKVKIIESDKGKEEELLQEMDEILDEDLLKEEKIEEEKTIKKKETKSKSKSRSLAA